MELFTLSALCYFKDSVHCSIISSSTWVQPRPGLVIQVTPDLWSKVPARRSRLSFLIYNPSLPLVLFNPNLPWSKFSPDLTSSMLRKYWKHLHQLLFAFLIKTLACPELVCLATWLTTAQLSYVGWEAPFRKARCPNSFALPPSKGHCVTLFSDPSFCS